MTRRDSLLAALVAALWGFNFVVIELGLDSHGGRSVPPLLFAAVRFTLVALPAVFLLPRPAAPWWAVAAVGTFMSLGQFGFLYVSMDVGMPAGLASLVLQAQVVFTVVIATLALRERPTRAQAGGVAIGCVGLLVVALGRGGHVPLAALGLCLLAAGSWAVGNVVARAAKVAGGLSLTVWSALVVPVPLVLLSLLADGPAGVAEAVAAFGWRAAVSTLYTVVFASFVGYGIFNTLLARYPSSAVVPWILLVPPVGMVSAWLCLGETPSAGELLGGAVLVAGVLVAMRPTSGLTGPKSGPDRPNTGVDASEDGNRAVRRRDSTVAPTALGVAGAGAGE